MAHSIQPVKHVCFMCNGWENRSIFPLYFADDVLSSVLMSTAFCNNITDRSNAHMFQRECKSLPYSKIFMSKRSDVLRLVVNRFCTAFGHQGVF